VDVPSLEDWHNEPWEIDTPYAYQNFYGLDLHDATLLFHDGKSLHRQENLVYMPSRVFRYYVKAFVAYLLSGEAMEDSDGASGFISMLELKIRRRLGDVLAVWNDIRPALIRLSEDQAFYAADPRIYGDFRTRIKHLGELGIDIPPPE